LGRLLWWYYKNNEQFKNCSLFLTSICCYFLLFLDIFWY
jgi:hypothetical protein